MGAPTLVPRPIPTKSFVQFFRLISAIHSLSCQTIRWLSFCFSSTREHGCQLCDMRHDSPGVLGVLDPINIKITYSSGYRVRCDGAFAVVCSCWRPCELPVFHPSRSLLGNTVQDFPQPAI